MTTHHPTDPSITTLSRTEIAQALAAAHYATANPALTPLVIALTLACQDKNQRPEAALMQLIASAKHPEESANEHQQ